MLGTEPRALPVTANCSTTELHLQSSVNISERIKRQSNLCQVHQNDNKRPISKDGVSCAQQKCQHRWVCSSGYLEPNTKQKLRGHVEPTTFTMFKNNIYWVLVLDQPLCQPGARGRETGESKPARARESIPNRMQSVALKKRAAGSTLMIKLLPSDYKHYASLRWRCSGSRRKVTSQLRAREGARTDGWRHQTSGRSETKPGPGKGRTLPAESANHIALTAPWHEQPLAAWCC